MRCVAGVGLIALVGCNQLFSLSPTREFDAAVSIDVIPDMPHIELTYQIAGVLPSGAPDPAIAFAPLVPAPAVKIALLPPVGQPMEKLAGAAYEPTGLVLIPREYLTQAWRLEYTFTDGVSAPVPHEIQWLPDDGHLTVPLFGRVVPGTLPVGAGYRIKPNGVSMFNSPQVLTTGLWTDGGAKIDPVSSTTINYVFTDDAFLSGRKGGPDPALGDHAFLIDVLKDAQDCSVAVGSVILDSATVQTGTPPPQVPSASWDAATKPVSTGPFELKHVARLQTNLGKLHTAVTGTVMFGHSPSLLMPGLARASRSLPLPVPVMAQLLQCPYSPNPGDGHPGTPPATAQPAGLGAFAQIFHMQLVDPRTVLGVALVSGMETVVTSTRLPSGVPGFALTFPAAIPGRPVLTSSIKGAIDLAADGEQIDIGPLRDSLSQPVALQLSFTPEVSTSDLTVRADYHDILLHRFDGATLTTDRIYTVTAPTVQIDSTVLRPDTTYVFEIRTYKGHPTAAHGDFRQIEYPYGAAIVFTRTFKTAP